MGSQADEDSDNGATLSEPGQEPLAVPRRGLLNWCNDQEGKRIALIKRKQRAAHVDSPDYKYRVKDWMLHRKRVREMTAVVDSTPPKVPYCYLESLKKTRAKKVYGDVDGLHAENMELIKRIATIYFGEALVDDHLDPINYHINTKGPKSRTFEELFQPIYEMNLKAQEIKASMPLSMLREAYKQHEFWMQFKANYPLFWKYRNCSPFEARALTRALQYESNPIAFFEFEIDKKTYGRVAIELDPFSAPGAVENFIELCTTNYPGLHSFMCRRIDSMWPDVYWKIGQGVVGLSNKFSPKKRHMGPHNEEGIVTLVSNGSNGYEGDFMIIAKPLPPLDGVNLPIGKVVHGMEFLKSLDQNLRPNSMIFQKPVQIIQSGLLPPGGLALFAQDGDMSPGIGSADEIFGPLGTVKFERL